MFDWIGLIVLQQTPIPPVLNPGDVSFNPDEIRLLGAVAGCLCLAIGTVFRMAVKAMEARAVRAENQVDRLLVTVDNVTTALEKNTEGLARVSRGIESIPQILSRLERLERKDP